MTDLQIFKNDTFGQVRILEKDNELWFVAKDVADTLGYQNGSRDVNRHTDEEDRTKTMVFDGNQNKETILINESGLYSLVLSSKLPTAKQFKRWVTSEVLPEIRKTGSYSLPDFNDPVAAARAWADEVEKKRALLVENNQLKDDLEEESEFRRKVFDTDSCITFTDAAKIIKPHFKKFGRKKLLEFLKDIRAINQNNTPYANQIEAGRFTVKEKFISPDGYDSFVKKQAYLTQKGIEWVIREYREYLKDLEEE